MPIFDETWSESDYMYRHHMNFKTLPANHLKKLRTLKFDFVEYKANHLVACHLYERMIVLCHNQYGYFEEYHNRKECMNADSIFRQCIHNHEAFGWQKRYLPELFASDPRSRAQPGLGAVFSKETLNPTH